MNSVKLVEYLCKGMDKKFTNKCYRLVLVLIGFLMLSACNSGKGGLPVSLAKLSHISESKLIAAYRNYLESLDSPDFPLAGPDSDSFLAMQLVLKKDLSKKSDILYFPATLWQMVALGGEKKWEQSAQNFSNAIKTSGMNYFAEEGDSYEKILQASYLYTNDAKYLELLLQTLSKGISKHENEFSVDSLSGLSKALTIDKLLENQVLFFASDATGDPVYKNFALQNSELIYSNYFKNFQADPVSLGTGLQVEHLLHPAKNTNLQKLENRNLAIGLYGYSYLFKETGMEKYQHLSKLLAGNFIRIYNYSESERAKESGICINHEMELITQALVSVALYDLGDYQGTDFRETSAQLYQHILSTLDKYEEGAEVAPSFELFYYLFEYQKRLQTISIDRIKNQRTANVFTDKMILTGVLLDVFDGKNLYLHNYYVKLK